MFKGIQNIFIHHGKVEQKLGSVKRIDTIVLDPPRNGVSKQVINQIIEKKPKINSLCILQPINISKRF